MVAVVETLGHVAQLFSVPLFKTSTNFEVFISKVQFPFRYDPPSGVISLKVVKSKVQATGKQYKKFQFLKFTFKSAVAKVAAKAVANI